MTILENTFAKLQMTSPQPFKISILNDEPNWGQVEVKELRNLGFTVTSYPSTSGLLPFLNFPSLFILNITNPQTNKFQLVKDIRAASGQVGILLILSNANPDESVQAFVSGADNYILRPYEVEDMLAIVCSLERRLRSAWS